MPAVITTAPAPPAPERAGLRRCAPSVAFLPAHPGPNAGEPGTGDRGFRVRGEQLGPLRISRVSGGPGTAVRDERSIDGADAGRVTLVLQHSGTSVLTQDGREAVLSPGRFALLDWGRPCTTTFPGDFVLTAFRLPRQALGVREEEVGVITARTFSRTDVSSRLVAGYLEGLARESANFDSRVAARLAATAVDLLSLLIQKEPVRPEPARSEAADHLVPRIKEYTVEHLADPELSPERIATAHFISLRYLHRLFEAEGMTLSRWILRRRLDMCRRDLARRGASEVTVASVAHRWGFVSAAHFSRAFRATYGVTPREWRAQAWRPA